MTYLSRPIERRTLSDAPLDSRLRGLTRAQIAGRLIHERGLSRPPEKTWSLLAILLVERAPDEALARSIRTFSLQSHPDTKLVLAPVNGDAAGLADFLNAQPLKPLNADVWPAIDTNELKRADWVTFIGQGEWLHPSAAYALQQRQDFDVVLWSDISIGPDRRLTRLQRNPILPSDRRRTLWHAPFIGRAFAVRGGLAATYSGDLIAEAAENSLHAFQIWLSEQAPRAWDSISEPFGIREGAPPSCNVTKFTKQYEKALAPRSSGFRLQWRDPGSAAPYHLCPTREAAKITVVIPFRDKPHLTLRALNSIANQDCADRIDIILVDNQSRPDTLVKLRAFSRQSTQILTYDRPFNHSAQCNLAIARSDAPVIVLFNNDCELTTPSALREMAAWALEPGIATVGLALKDPRTKRIEAGFSTRNAPGALHDSILEAETNPGLTPYVRDTWGNSFACAAIPRALFNEIGALDERRFPNGYNDIEFACRAITHGKSHITLGHHEALHETSASRARIDETPQKILLRQLYPAIAAAGATDLHIYDAAALRAEEESRALRTPASDALGVTPKRNAFQRAAGRLAETPLAQVILRNPAAYKLARRMWRLGRKD